MPLLAGQYQGHGRGGDVVISVAQTQEGIAFSAVGGPAGPLSWVEDWTFRRNDSLLTFRRTASSGPATERENAAGQASRADAGRRSHAGVA